MATENQNQQGVTLARKRFVMVPAEFLTELVKKKEYAWVFMVLWDKAGQSREAWISNAKLVESCRMNVHTVKEAMKWLQQNGYVRKVERPGQVNHYELSLEGSLKTAPDPMPEEAQAPSSPRLPGAPPTLGSLEPPEPKNPLTSEPLIGATGAKAGGRSPEVVVNDELPEWAQPYRKQILSWLRNRKKKSPKLPVQISDRSIKALSDAKELGVIDAFCDLVSESAWNSLGFAGYKDYLQKLVIEKKGPTRPGNFANLQKPTVTLV